MKVSVLIPTINRPESLKRTIDSYLSGDVIPDEIIVVDQTIDKIKSLAIKDLVVSYSQTKMLYFHQATPSLTMARNQLLELSSNDVLIFSDDDIDVMRDTVANVCKLMADTSISMIGGIDGLTPKTKSTLGYFFGLKSFKHRKIGHVTNSVLGRFPIHCELKTNTMWAMGFFFVVRKSLVKKWNLSWDEKLTSYAFSEDLDFSYYYYKKSKEYGLKCIFSNQVIVNHLVSREYRIPDKKNTFMFVLNRAYISNKHKMGLKSEIAMMWSNYGLYLLRLLKNENPEDFKEALIYLKNNREKVNCGDFPYNNF